MTSLGPAYIKLGQALSIRPDILSPAAMVELQKLCDKVPSFDNVIAMKVIEDELGAPWHQACHSHFKLLVFRAQAVFIPVLCSCLQHFARIIQTRSAFCTAFRHHPLLSLSLGS